MSGRLEIFAPDGVGEVRAGDDLVALLLDALAGGSESLTDGDVVLVTSKVVSKAEGRVVPGDREAALAGETARVVARRGPTTIVRTHHGLTLAAAGIDASNVATGSVVLLPEDPDASARLLRATLRERTGRRVGVLVTDTAGRAWREGQTDIAVGAAGVRVAEDYAGRSDGHGNPLAVTAPAVADELAGAAELAQGKLGARPFAVVRGRGDLVLAVDDDGPGARALVRAEVADMFGYGAREAVLVALSGVPGTGEPFGSTVDVADLHAALLRVTGDATGATPARLVPLAAVDDEGALSLDVPAGPRTSADALAAVCFSHGWELLGCHDRSWPHPSGRRVGPVTVRVRPSAATYTGARP